MKYILLFTVMSFVVVSVYSQTPNLVDSLHQPIAKFDKKVLQFETVKMGTIAIDSFVVTNIGEAPLVIKRVKANCGCTIADYTKYPILPNKKGTVKISYTAGSKATKFMKSIVISTNTQEKSHFLRICGEIIE